MFSSWADSNLGSAITSLGQIVAPYSGDDDEGEMEDGDLSNVSISSDDYDARSAAGSATRDGRGAAWNVRTRRSASSDTSDSSDLSSHGTGHHTLNDGTDAGDGDGDGDDTYLGLQKRLGHDDGGVIHSPAAAVSGPGRHQQHHRSPVLRRPEDSNVSSSNNEAELREKVHCLELTVNHLVSDQEALEKKIAEKNRIIGQLTLFEGMVEGLRAEVEAERARADGLQKRLDDVNGTKSTPKSRSRGRRGSGDLSDGESEESGEEGEGAKPAAGISAANAEAEHGAKVSELVYALSAYESRVQQLQIEVDDWKQRAEKGPSEGVLEGAAEATELQSRCEQLAHALAQSEARGAEAARASEGLRVELAELRKQQLEVQKKQELVLEEARANIEAAEARRQKEVLELTRETERLDRELRASTQKCAEMQQQLVQANQAADAPSSAPAPSEAKEPDASSAEATSLRLEAIRLGDRVIELQEELSAKDAQREEVEGRLRESEAAGKQWKAKFQSQETEAKQLHQVISQLRQTRRGKTDENEAVLQERNALRDKCATLTETVENLRSELQESVRAAESAVAARLQAEGEQWQERYEAAAKALEETQDALATAEKDAFDARREASSLSADFAVLQSELGGREQEVASLSGILGSMERDCNTKVNQARQQSEEALAALRKQHASELEKVRLDQAEELNAKADEVKALQQEVEKEALLRRKAQLDYQKEQRRLQASMDSALKSMRNTNVEEVVDRTMIGNLIVSYVERRRSLEIMQLIANICHFNDDQMVKVGLKVAPAAPIMTSLFGAISSLTQARPQQQPAKKPQQLLRVGSFDPQAAPLEGDNLSELWINFLMQEAEGAPASPRKGPHASPSRAVAGGTGGGSGASDSVSLANDEIIQEMKQQQRKKPVGLSAASASARSKGSGGGEFDGEDWAVEE